MAVGANISYGHSRALVRKMLELLSFPKRGTLANQRKFCQKAGVPANNTAVDNPNALYDICIDTTNGDVYLCTAYSTAGNATTWTLLTI